MMRKTALIASITVCLGTVDFGINWLIRDNLKLDAGVNIGVTRAASDLNPFLGLTWRY